ncbi:hypothetical protein [Curtobacterium sp. SORGH_AS_0776]|uniref:hypothetical protein n=1 Tax=Curtobacterium sp. SORGH_AS_0776 TaxID=3041798 RepID=UPI00286245E7|nr:hypothetical protein [Curtobacterium sp. SORGH_AS_0776]MDR6170980.1 hypothetical protein [Curtobacterium sp. SORGH_AS_0776]
MSSSDAQPPLSRRQARERERAAAGGAQPVTPPPTVAAPAEQPEVRHRPGSHVAPAPGAPAQSAVPSSASSPSSAGSGVPSMPPASATEIVPGSGGLTRRQIRQLRAAEGQAIQPVPLQNPTPQSSDRTVEDVLGSVDALHGGPERPGATDATGTSAATGTSTAEPEPLAQESSVDPEPSAETVVLDQAAVAQATEADGSPDAIEPLEEAAAHSEEPRRHRSTWAPPEATEPSDTEADSDAPSTPDTLGTPDVPATAQRTPIQSSTPAVFPLSLDEDDTNEVPVQNAAQPARAASAPTSSGAPSSAGDTDGDADAPRVPASFQRPAEPKPLTTAFEPPVGHWSQQAHDSNDAEVHDEETGTRRVAVTNTNAIILPNSALADPTGALNATGEVILTGSIDLPASLSSTGSHRPIDGAEVDRLLEQHDEQPDTDASPVRASRAVSSHTSTRQVVLAAAKPKESRMPVVLAVTIGSVGVAAAAVIIVSLLVTHTF